MTHFYYRKTYIIVYNIVTIENGHYCKQHCYCGLTDNIRLYCYCITDIIRHTIASKKIDIIGHNIAIPENIHNVPILNRIILLL